MGDEVEKLQVPPHFVQEPLQNEAEGYSFSTLKPTFVVIQRHVLVNNFTVKSDVSPLQTLVTD